MKRIATRGSCQCRNGRGSMKRMSSCLKASVGKASNKLEGRQWRNEARPARTEVVRVASREASGIKNREVSKE